jgi:hypothetical protein
MGFLNRIFSRKRGQELVQTDSATDTLPEKNTTLPARPESTITNGSGLKVTFDAPGFDGIIEKMHGTITDYKGGTAYEEQYYAVLLMPNGADPEYPQGAAPLALYLAVHSDPQDQSVGTILAQSGKANIEFIPHGGHYTEVIVKAEKDVQYTRLQCGFKFKSRHGMESHGSFARGIPRPTGNTLRSRDNDGTCPLIPS